MKDTNIRCGWAKHENEVKYHDEEWGIASHDDAYIFEMLILEGMQAGLSWLTVLNKREDMRKAFMNFDYQKLALRDIEDIGEWMQNEKVIRNRLKLKGIVKNARAFIKVQEEFGSFDSYIWSFTDGKQLVGAYERIEELPSSSELSDTISKDMKKRGFTFVGTTIIYSFLQAIGVLHDHVTTCFCYKKES